MVRHSNSPLVLKHLISLIISFFLVLVKPYLLRKSLQTRSD
ncbi:hypothetical protein PCS8106_01060 [Streptococcus pneumoniae PCS8106]|nr:hypothetical protein PCS8106_01060 [Streptococcus pneumoniae PCS8106]